MAAFYLSIAIIAEVIATSALKSSEAFTRLGPSLIVITGYSAAFYFLAIALRTIPIGIAYAIWAGAGITIITVVGALAFKQIPDTAAIIGITLIVAGVIVINVFSRTTPH